ncbi:MAG TPA: GNAT family N-acetyltransferase [Alphaproteobacteria bacterium]|nr:GNAT family N-acetyltransferase [Alphaproteobacteria bacterium]
MRLIRRLGPGDVPALLAHLLGLSQIDRRLRFCGAASDSLIRHYCATIDWGRSLLLGCFSGRNLVGAIHLLWSDPARSDAVEFTLSVDRQEKGKGIGTELLQRAMNTARSRGVSRLNFVCPAEDEPMQRLALKMGGRLLTDGVQVDGTIELARPTEMPAFAVAPAKEELRRSGTR